MTPELQRLRQLVKEVADAQELAREQANLQLETQRQFQRTVVLALSYLVDYIKALERNELDVSK